MKSLNPKVRSSLLVLNRDLPNMEKECFPLCNGVFDSTSAIAATANTKIRAANVKGNTGLLKPYHSYMFRPVSHFQAVKMI